MTRPITYHADSAAAMSFARVYGDRLQSLDQRQRMFILLSLAYSLFNDDSIMKATSDLDFHEDMEPDFVEHLCEKFDGQDERTMIGMIQATAMVLGDE